MRAPHPLQGLPLLGRLPADARDELRLLLEAAASAQERRHQAALALALQHVPALLRGTVRNLLAD
ncbi:MAG: hypothetical protein V4729_13390 [Pseudomonadota bacterium]